MRDKLTRAKELVADQALGIKTFNKAGEPPRYARSARLEKTLGIPRSILVGLVSRRRKKRSSAIQKALKNLGIVPEGTAYCGRKQNAHVERVIGTLRADCFLPEECETFEEANALVARAITEYKRGTSLFQSGFYES